MRTARPALSSDEVYRIIKSNAAGINILRGIEIVILALWFCMMFAEGSVLYRIDPSILISSGWAHSVTHFGWWFLVDLIVALFGVGVTFFTLQRFKGVAGLELSLDSARRYIILYLVLLSISMVSDVIHIVLTGLEIGDAESTFYVQSWGVLIAFIVVYTMYVVLLKTWIWYRVYVYFANLGHASSYTILFSLNATDGGDDLRKETMAMENAPIHAQAQTPLLGMLRQTPGPRKMGGL